MSKSPTKKQKTLPVRGYIDGCFDIMHSGHYNAIRQAKSICDVLIVGVHSDEEIAKNKAMPVMKEEERYGLLQHIKWIDQVVHDVPYSPSLQTLEGCNADFVIHGDDMPIGADGRCAYEEIIKAGKLKLIKRTEGISTTDLVGRLLLLTKDHLLTPDSSTPAPNGKSRAMLTTTRRIAEFSTKRAPTAEDRVVYIDGAFDMFHVGHASTLKKAKGLGTFLLVGVFDDKTVNDMKGSNYPVMNLHERVLNVLACKWVDEVIIGAPAEITEDLIRTMGISVVAQGDYKTDNAGTLVQRNEVPRRLGIMKVISSDWPHLTTTEIARRIIENRMVYIQRTLKKAAQEDEFYKNRDHTAATEH